LKLKIDENLPSECAGILRGGGFEADTVADERLTGAEDSVIAVRSRAEGRVLITLDLDFANIRAYPPAEYAGIVVLRLKRQDKHAVLALSYGGPPWSWPTERRKVNSGSWNPIAYDSGWDREPAGPDVTRRAPTRPSRTAMRSLCSEHADRNSRLAGEGAVPTTVADGGVPMMNLTIKILS